MKPRLMHGYDWSGQDVSGWWYSEKLDGWRAYWDGRSFISRQGEVFNAPDWFKAGMPSQPLDGELWAGPRTTHNDVNSAIRSGDWLRLSFRPFDIPQLGFKVEDIAAKLASLPLPAHAQPVVYSRVETTDQAIAMMRHIVNAGGEGVMLRKYGSGYSPDFRSEKLLKLKPGMAVSMFCGFLLGNGTHHLPQDAF